jgi:aryl-alcohol dehydrogenase-like predicted oxidoreductase
VSTDQLAIAAALAQPWAWRVLSGAATTDQVRSNMDAAHVSLPGGTLDELVRIAEEPERYWADRSSRPWT